MPQTFRLDSLSTILAKKAAKLTEEDIEATVAYLRAQRAKFATDEIEKAKKPPKKVKGSATSSATDGPLDLEALGLL